VESGSTRFGTEREVLFASIIVMASEQGREVRRTWLRDLLWPDAPDESSRHCLRQMVYKMRRSGLRVQSTSDTLTLPLDAAEADFAPFLVGADQSDQAQLAAMSIHGSFLPGFVPQFSTPLSQWIEHQRLTIHGRIRRLLLRTLQRRRNEGDWDAVESLARQCLVVDQLNEEATLALAEVLALGGSKATAVSLLDRYVADVGPVSRELTIPAAVLRRRIAERPVGRMPEMATEGVFVGRS
jgi:DNA-binding SARP family transcriptional activator